jgi:hypothetical protein
MDQADRLEALLEACHEVLASTENCDDEVAEAIRETCRTIEARLRALGVSSVNRSANPSY